MGKLENKLLGTYFMWDYISNFSHDNVPIEVEAERGRTIFSKFNRYIRNLTETKIALKDLFDSNKSDKVKIDIINDWWQKFISSQRKDQSK